MTQDIAAIYTIYGGGGTTRLQQSPLAGMDVSSWTTGWVVGGSVGVGTCLGQTPVQFTAGIQYNGPTTYGTNIPNESLHRSGYTTIRMGVDVLYTASTFDGRIVPVPRSASRVAESESPRPMDRCRLQWPISGR
jgi:hypothetical protein